MKHYGDITKINGHKVPIVDLVTFGAPCQDLSQAGKRKGLKHSELGDEETTRSGLFMEAVRIIKEMRDEDRRTRYGEGSDVDFRLLRPRYALYENVPGAFSSNKGQDFRVVLEEISKIIDKDANVPIPKDGKWRESGSIVGNGWSLAWRVFDAQFWGIPQRRKRIALVADFGSECASEILFIRKGLSRDFEQGRQKRKDTSANASQGPRTDDSKRDVAFSYQDREGCDGGGKGFLLQEDLSTSLRTNNYQTIFQPTVAIEGNGSRESHHGDGYSESNTMYTLNTTEQHAVAYAEPTNIFGSHNVGALCEGYARMSGTTQDEDVIAQPVNPSPNPQCFTAHGFGEYDELNAVGTLMCGQNETVRGDTPLVVESCNWDGTQTIGTLTCNNAGGNQRMPDKDNFQCVVQVSHPNLQDTTEALMASGYTKLGTQEATNGMFVVEQEIKAVDCRDFVEGDVNGTLTSSASHNVESNNVVRPNYIVRRLTPLECERLQGFPSFKEVDMSKMTKDEYIAYNIASGNIIVDAENGIVYGTRGPGGTQRKEITELKGTVLNGYKVVSIRNGDIKYQCRVHRVVWIARHGIIPNGMVIDHINNNKLDNRISNLQLLTPQDNSHKAKDDGLYLCGDENPASKLTEEQKKEIAFVYSISDATYRDLAEHYGISKSRIGQIVKEVGWTDIGEWTDSKGKKRQTSDVARYKALGNSICLPSWKWVLKRISSQYERDASMASLFDGIGGFPYLWEQINGKGSCLWASEIEDFPIAVTKRRFNNE